MTNKIGCIAVAFATTLFVFLIALAQANASDAGREQAKANFLLLMLAG